MPTDTLAPPVLQKWVNPGAIAHIRQGTMLLNRERAERVMDKYGLSALVAALPSNIYYLSSHLGISSMMGRHYQSFAVLPRNRAHERKQLANEDLAIIHRSAPAYSQ